MPDEPRRIAAILLVGFSLLTLLSLLLTLPADAQDASIVTTPAATVDLDYCHASTETDDAPAEYWCAAPGTDGWIAMTISGDYSGGENLPDHWVFDSVAKADYPAQVARQPYVAQSDRPHVSADCGPAWLGGCFHLPHRALADVVTDCHFWCFTVGLVGATAFDYAVTAHGLADGRCVEHNPNIGQHPTAVTFAKDFSETHLPVIALGLLIQKTVPRHPTTRPQKIATWIYPAMASYGMAIHASGAASWMGRCR